MDKKAWLVALAAAVALVAGATIPLSAGATPLSYVALGDSYTAAPLVEPIAASSPLLCLRSSVNYPHLTAEALGLTLADRSCSSATTANLTTAQYPGQPPQFDGLSAATSVVTVGIGGNDNNLFISLIVACSATDVLDLFDVGAPCQGLFGDFFVNEVNGDGPTVGSALDTIHARSPAASVFVVGYPDVLRQFGGCYPQLPLTVGDVAYANQIELALNAMLQREAAAHGATYVDTFTASVGHDACQSEATRWVEPLVPGTLDGFPVHPNAAGEAADARAVEAALRAAGL
jgi:GDSL-like Lipase/Acylhydrolase family